jgi:N-acetylglutamate synthase-like GNAT family acetyltransferase
MQMCNQTHGPTPACSSTVPERLCTSDATQQSAQIVELYKELEKISSALQQKDQENATLKEELDTRKEAHSRDIKVLEGMLQPLAEENKQLARALHDAYGQARDAHFPDIEALKVMLPPIAGQIDHRDIQALEGMLRPLSEEIQQTRNAHSRDIQVLEGMLEPLAEEIEQTRDAHSRDIQALEGMLEPLAEEIKQTRDAHSQDIQALEAMLRPLAEENTQLTQALQDAYGRLRDSKKVNLGDTKNLSLLTKQKNLDDSIQTCHTASTEPAHEPQSEPSPNLDTRFDEQASAHMLY